MESGLQLINRGLIPREKLKQKINGQDLTTSLLTEAETSLVQQGLEPAGEQLEVVELSQEQERF